MMRFFIDIKNKKWFKKLKILLIKNHSKPLLIYQICLIKNQKNLIKIMTLNMKEEIQIQKKINLIFKSI